MNTKKITYITFGLGAALVGRRRERCSTPVYYLYPPDRRPVHGQGVHHHGPRRPRKRPGRRPRGPRPRPRRIARLRLRQPRLQGRVRLHHLRPRPDLPAEGTPREGTGLTMSATLLCSAALGLAALLSSRSPSATRTSCTCSSSRLLWILLGQSWNLLGGYTGQVSFGHAAFFGVGAYTTGILVKSGTLRGARRGRGLLLGGLMAALVASVIGWICFRLRGPYFALSVLALSEVLRLVARQLETAHQRRRGDPLHPGLHVEGRLLLDHPRARGRCAWP